MRIESMVTLKGDREFNEDALILNENDNIYGVVDGVTSLIPYRNEKGETGGYIAANLVKEYFEKNTECLDLYEGFTEANCILKEAMLKENIDVKKKEQLWGAAAAIVKVEPSHIHFIQTGDCMIFVQYNCDRLRTLTYDQVAHIEALTLKKWEEGIQQGLKTKEKLRSYVHEVLVANRYKSNSWSGYGVINGEEEAIQFAEYGTINKTNIKKIILLSDGLLMHESSWEATARSILEMGMDNYAQHIQMIEDSDPMCTKYTRLKKSDDKTGIVIHF
jgi:serine/threonine protein phosphatase PrpC